MINLRKVKVLNVHSAFIMQNGDASKQLL